MASTSDLLDVIGYTAGAPSMSSVDLLGVTAAQPVASSIHASVDLLGVTALQPAPKRLRLIWKSGAWHTKNRFVWLNGEWQPDKGNV